MAFIVDISHHCGKFSHCLRHGDRTIPGVLKDWAETGRHHAGVIFVDEKTLRPSDVGGLARALRSLNVERVADDWRDQVIFLRALGVPGARTAYSAKPQSRRAHYHN